MALIDCERCKRKYSNIKDACPFCGHNPKEEAIRREIVKQTVQLHAAQINTQANFPRKNQATAAALAFFFWWIAADQFYLLGFFPGIAYLIVMPVVVFIASSVLLSLADMGNPIFVLLLSIFALWAISLIKALYYLSMDSEKFHRNYR